MSGVSKLLTRTEAAEFLNVRVSTLEAWACRRKGPPFVKVGGRAVRYRLADLERFVELGVVTAEAAA